MMNLQEKIRRILKGVAKKLSNKLHCDRHGSCVHFAELFVEEINNTHPELLKEFEVIEGYVDVKFGEGKPQEHTWIRLSDDEVIDPTFMQFTKYDKNAKYSRKRTKSYTGQEYYDKGVIESWFSKRREEQPDTVFKGGLEETIRRILREELASREVESIESNDELDEYSRTLRNARKQGTKLRFPKSAIKSNPLRFRPYSRENLEIKKLEQTEGLHDTSWENDEGDKITLMDLLNATEGIPVSKVDLEVLKPHLLTWDDDEEEKGKIDKADLQYPILIFVEDDGSFISIIDGHHRAQKAVKNKLGTIKAKVIPINLLPKDIRKVFGHMGRQEEMKEGELTEKCWKGYTKKGMKTMFGKRYPNCVKNKN